jgi:NADPH-dependent 2,4-dienoyl-CoA reductase/sulfur reductase-like enzyme
VLAGLAVCAHVPVSADTPAPPPAPAVPPRRGSEPAAPMSREIDLAIAIMERYQRMSREALCANGPATGGESSGGVAGGDSDQVAEAEVRAKSMSDVPSAKVLGVAGAEARAGAGDGESSKDYSSVPSGRSDALAEPVIAPASQPTTQAPATTKKRIPRVPAEKLFVDFDAVRNSCMHHVIVGGGTAAWSAIQAIRKRDASAAILLVTDEELYPYNRTPLSKELWMPGSAGLFTSEAGTRRAIEYSYAGAGGHEAGPVAPISILRGRSVVRLDVDAKTITLSDGGVVQYQKLLLATGGAPRAPGSVCGSLESEGVASSVSVFRTADDFRELREKLGDEGSSVAVIGGGFLGTELAVAMASEGRKVSLLCAEPGVLYKVMPRYLSQFLSRQMATVGVNVVASAVVTDAQQVDGGGVVLSLGGGVEECSLDPVNKVVVASGIVPRVELAQGAGLEIDQRNGGVVVNDQMNAEASVWVAGDVASFWDRSLGRRRVEHWGTLWSLRCAATVSEHRSYL